MRFSRAVLLNRKEPKLELAARISGRENDGQRWSGDWSNGLRKRGAFICQRRTLLKSSGH